MKSLFRTFGGQSHGTAGELGLAILRVGFGLAMAFGHGLGKLPPGAQLIGGVSAAGMPAPQVMAWFVALGEFAGGLLLALGLLTRLGAGWIAAVMAGAAFVIHGSDPLFSHGGPSKELALLYLLPAIAFLLRGGGRYALDARLFGKSGSR